jgi:hypothetical protein
MSKATKLGKKALYPILVNNLNTLYTPGTYVNETSSDPGLPGPFNGMTIIVYDNPLSAGLTQLAISGGSDMTAGGIFRRWTNTRDGVWSKWSQVILQDNVVGNVSYDAANLVSNGAIIETGSNANGTYTKFADGTMICRYLHSSAIVPTSPSGSLFWGQSPTLTFPASFIAAPIMIPYGKDQGSGIGVLFAGVGPTTCSINVYGSSNTASIVPGYLAIGRWRG